ncbi:type II secretion system F family protein [Streptomyces sp. OF3]|uniref:Type II secretion system F family protein n=1 Tax=Streptomyces alkaliterrae TaxID=2213162 RepID=A0A7W3ZLY3_9ACTN|nr:type II secretion system F family protein [Streptomyces alkaliterrae]
MAGAAALFWIRSGSGGARVATVFGEAGPPRGAPWWWSGPAARPLIGLLRRFGDASGATARLAKVGPPLPWSALPAGAIIGWRTGSWLPVLAGAAGVFLLRRLLRRRDERRAEERRAAAVIDLCGGIAAELRAGQHARQALLRAVDDALGPEAAPIRAAARFGGDVPTALEALARRPGAAGLRAVAACWRITVDGGTGLAGALERVAGALREDRDRQAELRAQLAGPRATAVILALLPCMALALGTAMGAEPLEVLLRTPLGWALLTGAAVLEWAGLAWVAGLARAAEGGPPVRAVP